MQWMCMCWTWDVCIISSDDGIEMWTKFTLFTFGLTDRKIEIERFWSCSITVNCVFVVLISSERRKNWFRELLKANKIRSTVRKALGCRLYNGRKRLRFQKVLRVYCLLQRCIQDFWWELAPEMVNLSIMRFDCMLENLLVGILKAPKLRILGVFRLKRALTRTKA